MTSRRIASFCLFLCLPFIVSCSTLGLTGNLSVRQMFTEGLAYEALSNYSAALDRYQGVLTDYGDGGPWSQRARLRMARIYKNHLNQPADAIKKYSSYLDYHSEYDRTRASVLMELARVYRDQGRPEDAIETYRDVVENYSSISQVEESYYNIGEIHLEQGRYEKTLATFNTLLESFPEGDLRDGALFQMGKAYEGLREYNKQLETYERLLKNHPDSDLHEYTLYLTVRLASNLDRRDVALHWTEVYEERYGENQYMGRIYDILDETWNIQRETD